MIRQKNNNIIIIIPSGINLHKFTSNYKREFDFAYSTKKVTHTRVDTGTCRYARTLKLVYCKVTVRLLRTAPNKTPYDKKQNSKVKETKQDTAGYENPKPL